MSVESRGMVVCLALLSFTLGSLAEQNVVSGLIDECDCKMDTINNFNNYKIYPQVQNLIRKDYFRYFKVDLTRPCPFWTDDSKCSLRDCSVQTCPDDEVPLGLFENSRGFGSGSGDLEDSGEASRAATEKRDPVNVKAGSVASLGTSTERRATSQLSSVSTTSGIKSIRVDTQTTEKSEKIGSSPASEEIVAQPVYYEITSTRTEEEGPPVDATDRSRTSLSSLDLETVKTTPALSTVSASGSSIPTSSPYPYELPSEDRTSKKSINSPDPAVFTQTIRPSQVTATQIGTKTGPSSRDPVEQYGREAYMVQPAPTEEQIKATADHEVPQEGQVYRKRSLKSIQSGTKNSVGTKKKKTQKARAVCDDHNQTLGKVDGTISEKSRKEFEHWTRHDDKLKNFCVFDDENSADATYVDLLLNPERFTGYGGHSARRVWKTIYDENCFKPPQGSLLNLNEMCLEKRVFYRTVSGLHTSINIHLCADYYLPKKKNGNVAALGPDTDLWGPNLDEFEKRFSAQTTDGEGPRRLRNLYFLYLLELRAIAKAADYLENDAPFYTSNKEDSLETRAAVSKFLNAVREFDGHFNESRMFPGSDLGAAKLKEEFRQHFLNISTIMDCVGCDKCRLWGKLQTQGLGTALKILFSDQPKLPLSRTEIVTLFNSFSRLSNSISELDNFRILKERRDRELNDKGPSRPSNPFASKVEL